MRSTLPSQNATVLKKLLRKSIVAVRRQLFQADMDLDQYEQQADGPVELRMDDDTIVHFSADTEAFSVRVGTGTMPAYGSSYVLTDVSRNSFWNERIGKEIIQIRLLRSRDWSEDYPSEFAVEFLLADGKSVVIEYLDEEDHPDMIRVTDSCSGQACTLYAIK